jgi:PPK2 family polyphosphate:nucleotide phosphotransferase
MKKIHLDKIDTRAPKDMDKAKTKALNEVIYKELEELQNLLYAAGQHALLIILQGMDASGKDGLIKDVFSCMNPQGVSVTSFKEPSKEEQAHDFLWRIHKETPARGMIKVFNRSHYEEILITRVHKMIDDDITQQRMQSINDFERHLTNNGTIILKFYLHVSAEEQAQRLEERRSNPTKMWKYDANDDKEAHARREYIECYEDIFTHCNIPEWHIIPADQNWYKAHLVAKKVKETLEGLNMQYPTL